MAPPIFGPDQVDPNTGSVSLPTKAGVTDDYWRNFYMQQFGQQRPGVDFQTANQDQARTRQQQVIQDLQRAAMGDPNSRAQQGLRDAYGSATSQQSSLGSTMRGQSAGAAQRSIAAGQQGIQRGYAGDSQMLQLQEQQAAQAMLAQLLSQQQGQDITQAQGMANAQLQGDALNEAMKQFYAQQGANYDVNRGQTSGAFQSAQAGFGLERGNILSGLLNRGVQGVATGVSTWGQMGGAPKSSQQTIDDAFNG